MDVIQTSDTYDEKLYVDKFVGREDLLGIVEQAVSDVPNRHVLLFEGEGGMGKTALLRRVRRKYENDDSVVVIQLDYVQARFQSLSTLAESFIEQLSRVYTFSQEESAIFYSKLRTAQGALAESREDEIVDQLEFDAYLFLIHRYNDNASANTRLVILSDSIEVAIEADRGSRINRLASEFSNAVIVLAGRPQHARVERYKSDISNIFEPRGWIYKRCVIEPFSLEDAISYFAQVLPTAPESSLVEKIVILTEGKPILLAITAEWFKHNVRLPEELDRSKQELESLDSFRLQRLQRYFERTLVRRVREVREPLYRAILYLSFLDRRYDKRILQLALDLPMANIEAMEPELRRMAFIRSFMEDISGLLHDEAKDLINEHAWPPHDSDGQERRALADKIIDGFYLPEIERLHASAMAKVEATLGTGAQLSYSAEELLAHELEMECVDYQFRVSPDRGRRYITRLIGEGVSLPKREGLPKEVESHLGEEEEQVTKARINVARGYYEGSRQVLERALKRKGLSPWYRTSLLRELSEATTDPEGKETRLKEAMRIAETTQDQEEMAKIYNQLGLVYRRQGLWDEAESAYQQTLTILQEVDDLDQKAGTLNNLAYIKFLRGDLDLAENLIQVSLRIRESTGNQLGLAFGYLASGDIAKAKGQHEQAVRAYEVAASLFEKLGREQNHAQALIHLAEAKLTENDFDGARELLQPGLKHTASKAWAERALGVLHREKGMQTEDHDERTQQYEAAVAAFQQSLQTCEQTDDAYGQALALFDLIQLHFIWQHTVDQIYTRDLEAVLAQYDYPLIKAQLENLYADIACEEEDIDQAFRRYIEAAKVFSIRDLQKYGVLFGELKRKFFMQPPETQHELCAYFDQVITELPQESRLRSSLSSLCWAVRLGF